ncbi:hypothetical protein ACFYPB_32040 [Streptomyces olivaceoviridis]|uniref:hypothetical protein n=1 Tax=Streptomyces olivaceoviridis TaxID=1921 RepID=UPI0036C3B8E3
MAKVVEPEVVGETGGGSGAAPLPTEGATAEGRPLLTDEDQAVRPLLGEPGEVLPQLLVQEGREYDDSGARGGLGGAGSALAVGPLGLGAADADDEVVGVDVPAPEAMRLSVADSARMPAGAEGRLSEPVITVRPNWPGTAERHAMGASTWDYVTPYRGDLEATLGALHDEVFQKLYGDDEEYGSREELYADGEFMGEEGTHSILDVHRIVATTEAPRGHREADYFTLRPLSSDRLVHHFGTDRPTVQQYQDAMARSYEAARTRRFGDEDTTLRGEHRMRWTGVYVLLYTENRITHVGFFGSSGD